jgi:hypothetical protein
MIGRYVGELNGKIVFLVLPQIEEPIASGIDDDSLVVGAFLSAWNSQGLASDLLDYLIRIQRSIHSNQKPDEVYEDGLHSLSGAHMKFQREGVVLSSDYSGIRTDVITYQMIISVVRDWVDYLNRSDGSDSIYFNGKLYKSNNYHI